MLECSEPGKTAPEITSDSENSISVRRAGRNDVLGILACLHAAFEPFRDRYTPGAYLDTVLCRETLEERLAQMQVFVAQTSSGKISGTIACVATGDGEGHLRGMAVLPGLQGTGIAAQLLSAAEAELWAWHCTRITLDTTEPLERAIRFYERSGFRRSGKVTDFYGMPLFEFYKALRAE